MTNEPIRRNRYAYNNRECLDEGSRFFNQDFDEFHLPFNRVQLANLHEGGVAQGLEVSGTLGGTTLTVGPGVAIDGNGELISLSADGQGSIGNTSLIQTNVPVEINLTEYQREVDTTYTITIAFQELEQRESGHPCDRLLAQTPWVRLQTVAEGTTLVNGGTSVPLGQVVVTPTGQIARLSPVGRRLVGKTLEQLVFQRPQQGGDQLGQQPAGQMGPAEANGLQITVPQASDGITLSQADGNRFAQLAVQSENATFSGGVTIDESLQIGGPLTAQNSLSVSGDTNIGGPLTVQNSLSVNSEANIGGPLTVQNNLSVSGDTDIGGTVRIKGNLEVQGDVIARDAEHIAGNVVFGDADNDEVKITGVLRSGHSSRQLQVDAALHATGKLTVDGELEVKGNIKAGNSDLYFTKTNHNHTGLGNTKGYAAIENAASHDALMILGRAGTAKGRYVRLWDYLQVNGGMDVTSSLTVNAHVRADGGFQVDGKQVIDADAGWHRTYGNTGWYNGTHGGGWHMSDSTWIRSYGGKDVYCNKVIRADGGFQVDGKQVIDADAGWHRTYGKTGWYNQTYSGGWHMSDSTWIRSFGGKNVYCDKAIRADGGFQTYGTGITFFNATASQHWSIYPEWNDAGDPDLFFYFSHPTAHSGWARAWIEPGGGLRQPSDARLKQDIKPLTNVLKSVMELQPKTYRWAHASEKDTTPQIGFIAQEVEQTFPDFISKKHDVSGLNYHNFTVVAIAAIQEQQASINALKSELADLRASLT